MRYASIDLLRTIAIFVMVLVHFGENLSGYTLPATGFGAPLFAFVSGVSFVLWSMGRRARGTSEQEISKVSVRRGLFVFGVGFAFNILVWLPEDTFNWDVLTFIGVALLMLNVARKFPLSISVVVAVVALLISPVLRALADFDAYWESGYFECDLTLSEVLIGFLVTGYFPVFPWIAFSLAGFVTASLLFAEPEEPSAPRPSPWPMVLLGSLFLVAACIALAARTYLPPAITVHVFEGWTVSPPTVEYVLGMLGVTLMLFGAAHRYVDGNPRVLRYRRILNVATTFSRYSFTIYVLHHVVHLWPLWIYGMATGHEPTHFWMKAMPISVSVPLALLFLACCYGALRWLGPERAYGIEACMRWLCD